MRLPPRRSPVLWNRTPWLSKTSLLKGRYRPSNEDNTGDDEPERQQLRFDDGDEDPADVLPKDKDGYAPAPLVVGNTHLVRLEGISWGLAKYVYGSKCLYRGSGRG